MEKVRFGLIGIGAQGGAYAGFLTGQGGFPGMPAPQCPPHCALGALCDIDPEKEKMCREKYPDVPFFKDWKEMVASGTVDAVITTVPHYLHHEIAIYCLEHGMNVLVEKPAGVRAKDVMAMNKCAEEHPDVAFGIMLNQCNEEAVPEDQGDRCLRRAGRDPPLQLDHQHLVASGQLLPAERMARHLGRRRRRCSGEPKLRTSSTSGSGSAASPRRSPPRTSMVLTARSTLRTMSPS